MTKYNSFFFDFDGVLVDSIPVKTKAFAELFKKYGAEIQKKVVQYHFEHGGITRKEKIKYYYDHILSKPLNKEQLEKLCKQFSQLVVEKVAVAPEIKGVQHFLEKYSGFAECFIVSAAPHNELVEIVRRRGIYHYFQEITGSEKTKQQNLKYLIDKYKIKPEKSIFFGDAESDWKAAFSCGVDFLGIVPGLDAPLLKIAPNIKWIKNFHSTQIKEIIA